MPDPVNDPLKEYSWCEETGEKVLNKVTALFRNETKDLVHLSIAGEEVTTKRTSVLCC